MKIKSIIIAVGILFIGCQESIDPDIDIQENLVVIDGWVYNKTAPQTIRITRSVAFESLINSEPIRNASVIIRDTRESVQRLVEDSPGVYISDNDFFGEPGLAYQLEITLSDGETYISEFETLNPVPEIDTLILEPDFVDEFDPLFEPFAYFPVAFVNEFEEKGDFYRWRLAKNEIYFNGPEDIILQTDRFVNGNLFKNEFKEYLYFAGDSSTVQLESLTQEAYNFLRFFRRQTTDLGTSGGTNPGALRGNMRNKNNSSEVVLGYFGASAVSTSGKRIEN